MNDSRSSPDALDDRIDEALRRRFAPPADLDTLGGRTLPRRGTPLVPWLVLAVSAAASVAVLLWASQQEEEPAVRVAREVERTLLGAEPIFCRLVGPLLDGQPEPGFVHSPDLERLYHDMDACQLDSSSGATCGASDNLAERMSATYGQAIALRPEAAGRLHGPFGSDEWPTGTIVTGTSDDRTAVLVADRDATLACCVRMHLPEDSGLRFFVLRVGEVVLTEITPLAEPRLLPYFE